MPYKDKNKARDKYQEHSERKKLAMREYYAANRDRLRRRRLELADVHRPINAKRERDRYAAWRSETLAAYGGRCACCGETEPLFLEIDHVKSDGASHRKTIGRSARALLAWIRKAGFPPNDFQILCSNCNQGRKRNGGQCPHLVAKGRSSLAER